MKNPDKISFHEDPKHTISEKKRCMTSASLRGAIWHRNQTQISLTGSACLLDQCPRDTLLPPHTISGIKYLYIYIYIVLPLFYVNLAGAAETARHFIPTLGRHG